MKKNTPDANSISDLLKKLHASYFGAKADSEKPKKKAKEDSEDEELLDQLKATLDKANDSITEEKPGKKAKRAKKEDKPDMSASNETVNTPAEPTSKPTEASKKTQEELPLLTYINTGEIL